MAITPLPALDRTSATFRDDVDTFFGAQLPSFVTEANTLIATVNAAESGVNASASSARDAANIAIGASQAAGAAVWASGTGYAVGDACYSPINFQTYRRKTSGAGTVDPSADSTNWAVLAAGEVTLAGNETLTNKRISAYYYLDKTVVNATATGNVSLDLSIGSVFDLTLSGNTTLSLANVPALSGETLSFVVKVTQGATAYALTWFSTITWLTVGGVAPAAPAANKTVEYIFTTTASGQYVGRKGAAT